MTNGGVFLLAMTVGSLQGIAWWLLDRSRFLPIEEAKRAARKRTRSNTRDAAVVVHVRLAW